MNMESQSEPKVDICLRFVRHPGIFSTLVQWAQGGFVQTHCEAILDDGSVIGAWFDGGTQVKPLGYDTGKFSHEFILNLEVTQGQQAAFYGFLRAELGKPYDALAIAAFAAGRDWQCNDSWFCSEYIGGAMVKGGIYPPFMAANTNKLMVKDVFHLAAPIAKVGQHA